MPSKTRNSASPPPVMTWGKAAPVLILGFVFDALRFMFEWLAIFAPGIAAIVCTTKLSSASTIATMLGGVGCTAGAAVIGTLAAAPVEMLGVILAMATGLAGWLIIGIILLKTNSRIFKENVWWFAASLLVSEVPIVGSVPAITLILWKMYSNQIRKEKGDLKKFEEAQAMEERSQAQAEQQMEQRVAQTAAMEETQAEEEIPAEETEPA